MKKLLLATAATLLASGTANAALVDMEVPDNAYITVGGFDWAWASPLDNNSLDLSFQSQFGWRLATVEELLNAPDATQFLFAGANVPLGGSDPVSGARFQFTDSSLNQDGAVAAPYFSNFSHVDWCNGPGSNCARRGRGERPWAGLRGASSISESLVIRASLGAVPEPATWAFMIFGFGAIGGAMRRQRKANVKVSYA